MSAVTCPREDELLDALGAGFVGAELEAHVQECASCSELRLVTSALLDERATAITEAPVPASGTMLWRMKMRRRQELQAAARRSLLVGQAVTVAVAIALIVVLFGEDIAGGVRELFATIRLSTPLALALAAWLLLAPIGGYVAIRQK